MLHVSSGRLSVINVYLIDEYFIYFIRSSPTLLFSPTATCSLPQRISPTHGNWAGFLAKSDQSNSQMGCLSQSRTTTVATGEHEQDWRQAISNKQYATSTSHQHLESAMPLHLGAKCDARSSGTITIAFG